MFGADTETLVQDEDTTLLSDPTIKPPPKSTGLVDSQTTDSPTDEWLRQLLNLPARVRNVAVIGHLHSGKTALLDLVLGQKHGTRYTDTRVDEQVWQSWFFLFVSWLSLMFGTGARNFVEELWSVFCWRGLTGNEFCGARGGRSWACCFP